MRTLKGKFNSVDVKDNDGDNIDDDQDDYQAASGSEGCSSDGVKGGGGHGGRQEGHAGQEDQALVAKDRSQTDSNRFKEELMIVRRARMIKPWSKMKLKLKVKYRLKVKVKKN